MIYYAVKQKSSGKFLPQLGKRRGYSVTEPKSLKEAVPRLHLTPKRAKLAATAWAQGVWEDVVSHSYEGEASYCGPEPKAVVGRSRDDLEVVRCRLWTGPVYRP